MFLRLSFGCPISINIFFYDLYYRTEGFAHLYGITALGRLFDMRSGLFTPSINEMKILFIQAKLKLECLFLQLTFPFSLDLV